MELLIGGQWTPAQSGREQEVRSPFDGSVVGTVPVAGLADVDAALTAPATGAKVWRNTPGHERMRILLKAADLADQRAEEIGQILSGENGKNITEARGGASRSGQDWKQLAAATLPMGKLGQVDEIADFVVSCCRTAAASAPGRSSTWTRTSSAVSVTDQQSVLHHL